MTNWTPVTEEEIAALNAARDALSAIRGRATTAENDWLGGRLAIVAETAEWQLFQVLNHASSSQEEAIPNDLLHNRKQVV